MITILVIDDDPETRAVIDGWLDDSEIADGHQFEYAGTDEDALTAMGVLQRIDIVFINIDTAALGGLDLFFKVENRETRFPRIALTNGEDLHRIRKAIADGAVEFMLKPLKCEDMMEAIGRIFTHVERRRKIWKHRAEYVALRREVSAAAKMQNRFLPKTFPEFKNLDVFARTKPAKDVGGDFFDVIRLDDNHIMVLVADVAGKSIPAAFYMAISRTLLHTLIIQGASPGECLELANDALCSYEIPGMFVSVICVLIDPANRTVCYSDGGHLPMLINRTGHRGPSQIGESGGPVLGVVPSAAYTEETINIDEGDSILLYSDGVSEAFNENRDQYGMDRLMDRFTKNASQSVKAIAMAVFNDVEAHAGNSEQSDDITVLCLKLK